MNLPIKAMLVTEIEYVPSLHPGRSGCVLLIGDHDNQCSDFVVICPVDRGVKIGDTIEYNHVDDDSGYFRRIM